jgi:LPXTG-motif cell wall-anchored protein
MKINQILGVALMVAGALLPYAGYQASQSLGEQMVETLTGRFTEETTWYFVLGAAGLVGGALLLALRR